jgi:hypothetical protein
MQLRESLPWRAMRTRTSPPTRDHREQLLSLTGGALVDYVDDRAAEVFGLLECRSARDLRRVIDGMSGTELRAYVHDCLDVEIPKHAARRAPRAAVPVSPQPTRSGRPMKALSVKQPWCELIARGDKSIEVRTWRTAYRGPLAIVASSNVDADAAADRPHVDCSTRGALVCVVELVDVRPLRVGDRYAAAGDEPGRARPGDDEEVDGTFAWVLAKPRRTVPVPVKGKLSLYEIDDGIAQFVRRKA